MENSVEKITIGKYLNSERKKKNLTIEDISDSTKIKVRLLEKLESNLFDDLGGIGYAKAMILTYARALGITEDQVHELLQNQFNSKPEYAPKRISDQPRKFLLPTKIFSIMLLIIVIAILSYFVINLYRDGVLTWPPFKRTDTEIQIRPKEKTDKTIDNTSQKVVPEIEKEKVMVKLEKIENPKVIAINDTTNHLNELLFKDKKSPFKYNE